MKDQLANLLFRAASTSFGIAVKTNDPERLRQKLYAIRRDNPAFEHLSLIIPSQPDTVHIINKAPDNGSTEARTDEENS